MASSWSEPLHFLNLGFAIGATIVVAIRSVLRRIDERRSSGVEDRWRSE